MSGDFEVHEELEAELAALKGAEAALVFTSGYAANVGLLGALAGPRDHVFSDALNNASLIDGCRMSHAKVQRYQHSDLDQLIVPSRNARIDHPDLRARNVAVHGIGHMSLTNDGGIAFQIAAALAHLDERVGLDPHETTVAGSLVD